MRVVDPRRLTGANLHDRRVGATLELRLDDEEPGAALEQGLARVLARLEQGLAKLGWSATTHVRRHRSGRALDLMITSESDRLYAAVDLLEWAAGDEAEARLDRIATAATRERLGKRGARELIARAEREGVPWLLDDDHLSLGHGVRAKTWPLGHLPVPDQIDWAAHAGRIPIALITGTNGKTTSARLLARIVRHAGLHVGNTSTDGIYVDEQLVDEGDWTGPGGARTLLRRDDVEFAVLEVARGGMLRRGLVVPDADAALITNISKDHLGEYGIETLDDLAEAKAIVTSVIPPQGRIVLGADSPALVELARRRSFAAPLVWVSLDPAHAQLVEHRAAGGECVTIVDEVVCWQRGNASEPLLALVDIPLTIAGRARHNVSNVLGVVALARALALPDAAIVAGLREFGAAPADNPGRARVWALPRAGGGEVTVLLDFAHNLAGIASIAELVAGLTRVQGRLVSFGMAGDRSDEDLLALARALLAFAPRRVLVREQEHYLRGRALGEVPAILAAGLAEGGFAGASVSIVHDECEALDSALAEAQAGELVVLLVHTDHEGVGAWLRAAGARPASLLALA
jgi:UDP-N-acetylmuramyl tripeptide synthase